MKPWIASLAVVSVSAALLGVAAHRAPTIEIPTIEITYSYSPDADDLLAPLVEKFNDHAESVDGHPIHVSVDQTSSGAEMLDLVAGAPRPTAWTPASQVWGGQLGERAQTEPPTMLGSVVNTPEVFAIWCSEAARHGWVDPTAWDKAKRCERAREPSWSEVVALARRSSPSDRDPFLLGQTNPEASTSGAFALASQYLTETGTALTPTLVADPTTRGAVRAVERSLVHYGPTSQEVKYRLCELGQAYVSAVYLQEATVLELNADKTKCHWGANDKLMAFYPSAGTFVADYPFYVLAPTGSLEARAAGKLWEWLRGQTEEGALALQDSHFRARQAGPASTTTEPGATVRDPDGVIERHVPVPVLEPPSPATLRIAQDNWKADRNPARVALVVDVSGPMRTAGQLAAMKDGLHKLVDELRLGDSVSDRDRDQVSLTTFSATVQKPLLVMGSHTQREIDNAIDAISLKIDGGTALFDGVWAGFAPFRTLTYDDDSEINALIVISSSVSDAGRLSQQDLLTPTRILPNLASRPVTRIFTVELRDAAEPSPLLSALSGATYGRSFVGGPDEIVHAFQDIPSYF